MTKLVDDAVTAATIAFEIMSRTTGQTRATWLEHVATLLDRDADELVPVAHLETRLPEARLRAEMRRTTYQLRAFAHLIRTGSHLGIVIDHANPNHPVAPAPDLRRMLVPIGPVAVFAASNFPFAFSVAGGDTASALAAGCPVIVKSHSGHPELSRLTAETVAGALRVAGAPPGVFGIIEGHDQGIALIRHPAIAGGAFTGSTTGGRALFDEAVARPRPIPFYGELGGINPVFVTAEAAVERSDRIATGFVESFTLGVGQFCTKPGVLVVPRGCGLAELVTDALRNVAPAPLLNAGISNRLELSSKGIRDHPAVETLLAGGPVGDGQAPALYRISAETALADPWLVREEHFGPIGLIVESDPAQFWDLAGLFEGTLTAGIQGSSPTDRGIRELFARLAERAGRVLWNEWPTGVTVSPAMHHGGPYPAATSAQHTSVGLTAIARFLRPICYQNAPDALLPDELREPNPLGLSRTVDGMANA